MSGFFGMVSIDGAEASKELLDQIARVLEFRGPVGFQAWSQGGVSFSLLYTRTCHQSSHQSVQLGERLWLVGDVRLDARDELIAGLRTKGQLAAEQASDEELLLQAWSLWREDTPTQILGDFSFGLWDAKEQSLYGARDFVGARPFYYAQAPGVFCFSNTLQVLRAVPQISGDLDEFFVHDFLLEGLTQNPERTVWRDVRRLPAGYRLKFAKGSLEVKRFLQLEIEEPLQLSRPEEYLENYWELVQRAVADRMPEGKVALYLSGGLDSSTVCAIANRLALTRRTSGELKAFTISWRPIMDDPEPGFAKVMARHLGLAHEVLEEERILTDEDTNRPTTPEPIPELFFGRACRLYRAISSHSRVVLSGDGGDDVLLGESWPYLRYLANRGEWRQIAKRFGGYLFRHGRIPPLRGGFQVRLRRLFRRDYRPAQPPSWLNPEFVNRIHAHSSVNASPLPEVPVHPFHPRAYRSLHSGYWASVLEEEDAGWTRVPLETRAPLLDLRLIQFLLRLPPVPWCMNKELTRRAMKDLLPVEILRRKKAPMTRDPLEAWQGQPRWRLEFPKNPPKLFHEFVKWDDWIATFENSKGSLSRENLYPLAFLRWLKDVEN